MVACSWKETFGIECFTCGFQRSIELLLKGEVLESIQMFPATIPLLLTCIFAGIHIWKRFTFGPRIIVGLFSFSALLILVNFTVKHALSHG